MRRPPEELYLAAFIGLCLTWLFFGLVAAALLLGCGRGPAKDTCPTNRLLGTPLVEPSVDSTSHPPAGSCNK